MEEGIVPGGGVALLRCIKALEAVKGKGADQQTGIDLVAKSLRKPLNTIAENAGVEAPLVVEKVQKNEPTKKWTYNLGQKQIYQFLGQTIA